MADKKIILNNCVIPAAFLSGNPWFDRLTMHPELVEGLDSCKIHAVLRYSIAAEQRRIAGMTKWAGIIKWY